VLRVGAGCQTAIDFASKEDAGSGLASRDPLVKRGKIRDWEAVDVAVPFGDAEKNAN